MLRHHLRPGVPAYGDPTNLVRLGMLGPEFETGRLPTFDGWTVIEKLGEGGMCAVYRAHPNDGLGPERALKVLTDRGTNATQRFMIEAELLQRIDHPNVVKVHFVERDARPPWIVMDLLQGRDFEERRLSDGATDPEHTARLFADLANGLATVHALGVRHRDIKPANIILGDDGVARLIDFGIARDTSDAHLTQQGFVVGTAAYLPPEIFVEDDAHQIQDSEVADVYALGQTLHEVLIGTSTYPPDGGTQTGLLVQIMRVKLDQPYLDPSVDRPQIPKGLAAVVRKATAQEPSERLQSAGALEEALRRWLVTRTSRAREAPVSIVDPHELPAPPVTEHIPTPDPLPRGEATPWNPRRTRHGPPTHPPRPASSPRPCRPAARSAVSSEQVWRG